MSYIGTQPVPQSLQSRQQFTGDGSTTTFATIGGVELYEDVFLNGVRLSRVDNEYSFDGTTLTITPAPANGDTVSIILRNDHSDLVALPITDSAGNNVLSESGGTVALTADTALIEGSSSGDLVRITQTGSGNALVVEDETNPDSTPFVVNASGSVGIGTDSISTIFHVRGTDTNPVALRMENTTPTTGKTWQIGSTNAGLLQLATIPGVADYLTVNSSGNLNLNGGGEYQKNGTTGKIITYGDVTVNGLTTSYQNIKITLPNSITHNQVVSIIPQQGVINDIVYIAEIALGVWSGIQTTNEARLSIRLGNAVASSDGIVRVWYIL